MQADPKQLRNLVYLLQSSPQKQREKLVPMPSIVTTFESVPTKLVVTTKRNYPVLFPPSLQQFQAVGINMNRFDEKLVKLENLRHLNLSNNDIKEIPESLQEISLVQLNLADNKIQNYPSALCTGKISGSLEDLDLSRNLLTCLPSSFVQLDKLVQLKVDNNNLIALPKCFGNLKHLQYFSASNNQLTVLPYTFRRLQLQSIDMFGNPFYNSGLITTCDHLSIPCLQELAARVIRRNR